VKYTVVVRTIVGVGAALVLGAGPAVAGVGPTADLTGSWTGQIKCKAQISGEKAKLSYSGTLGISQGGSVLAAEASGLTVEGFPLGPASRGVLADPVLCGTVQDTTGKPGSAQGGLAFYDGGYAPAAGATEVLAMVWHLSSVKVGEDGSGSIKGTATGDPFLGLYASCKLKFTRTSIVDPGVDTSACVGGP
jgi:autotransporter translocation and assembly factor TamB